jgi:hypothetical protein
VKLKSFSLCVAAVLTAGAFGFANAAVIDFEAGPYGGQPNGFSAAGVPGVTFTDTQGDDLEVQNFGNQSDGYALGVNGDDTSALRIDFGSAIDYLSIDFGNDDPGYASAGDLALLTVFYGGVQVGQTTTVFNLDDMMNQSVVMSGVDFDSATFVYADSTLNPINLIEIVDNVTFDQVAAVPEPKAFGLLALGLGFLALVGLDVARRKKRT